MSAPATPAKRPIRKFNGMRVEILRFIPCDERGHPVLTEGRSSC